MKTKKEKLIKKEVIEKFNELEDVMENNDLFFAVYNSGSEILCDIKQDEKDEKKTDMALSALFAHFLEAACNDKKNVCAERISEILICAFEMVLSTGNLKMIHKILKRIRNAAVYGLLETTENNTEDCDKDELCDDCIFVKTCNDKRAIEYRKAHGIRKPKSKKK